MARTKQTARKSTGGRAPRRQLATQSARTFRQFMTSQQSLGSSTVTPGSAPRAAGAPKVVSFVNYENTFSEFRFPLGPPEDKEDFAPRVESGQLADIATGITSPYVSVNFASRYDDDGMQKIGRPDLDLSIVLDISGSMSWRFEEDEAAAAGAGGGGGGGWRWGGGVPREKTKIGVAIRCIKAILRQLTPSDRVGIVLFNNDAHRLQPLTKCADIAVADLEAKLDAVQSSGGTDLHKGFSAGMKLLPKPRPNAMSRVVFLTDMESSASDELAVIDSALKGAGKKHHTTVVGVGVDLSVGTVERLSKIPGCKYSSVSTAREFEETVLSEFDHDVTPVAFGIELRLGGGWEFAKGYGSPEVNGVAEGTSVVTLSSEFPMRTGPGRTAAGTLLFRLQPPADGAGVVPVTTTWTRMDGRVCKRKDEVVIDPAAPAATGVRKAVAVVGYVDVQSDYVLDDGDGGADGGFGRGRGGGGGGAAKRRTDADRLAAHDQWVERLERVKSALLSELRACGDDSVEAAEGSNTNVRQTLDQMIGFERAEAAEVRKKLGARTGRGVASRATPAAVTDAAPDEFRCPVTKELMADPVMLSDGHTYEREAIERWIADRAATGAPVLSPMTNRRLRNLDFAPNHALRKLIDDYRAAAAAGAGAAGAAGAADAGGGGGAGAASADADATDVDAGSAEWAGRPKRRAADAAAAAVADTFKSPKRSRASK